MKTLTSLLLIYLTWINITFAQTGESIFDNNKVHTIEFTFQESNFWTILNNNYDNSIDWLTGVPTNVPYLMGTVSIDGNVIDSVGLRQKGFSSHFSSNQFKKSLKVKMNEYVSGQRYDGLKKFNLSNGVGDPALQRDFICYNIMRQQGITAPRTSYAEVYLNGTYWGLYLIVEQVDKTFVDDNFISGEGNLYKNIGWSDLQWIDNNPNSYTDAIELKTNETANDWSGFISFLDILNNGNPTTFTTDIESVFDIDYYLRILAIDVMTDNWDSYIDHGRNYYIYQEPISNQFHWIPWDYNLSMGGNFEGGTITDPSNCATIINGSCPYPPTDSIFQAVIAADGFCCDTDWDNICQDQYDDIVANGGIPNPGSGYNFPLIIDNPDKVLINRLMEVPTYREKYLNYCCQILATNYRTDRLFPIIEHNGALIDSSVFEDGNYNFPYAAFLYDTSAGNGTSQIPSIKEFLTQRIPNIELNLTDLNFDCDLAVAQIGWHDIVINEFSALSDSAAGVADFDGEYNDWIELYNNSNQTVDLTYYYLSDDNNNPIKWSFPIGTTIDPGEYLMVWADGQEQQTGLHCNFYLKSEGESLKLSHLDGTVIDSVTYPLQLLNMTYARVPNATGDFTYKVETFGGNNGTTGISETVANNYRVYPNPTHHLLNIELNDFTTSTKFEISIYAVSGQLVMQDYFTSQNGKKTLDISSLGSGIYTLQIHQSDGLDFHKKIIVK